MIAIYITTENMTAALHSKGRKRLKEAGAPEDAMNCTRCSVRKANFRYSISGRAKRFDAFFGFLVPILEELGIKLAAPPTIMPVVDLRQ